MAKQKNILIFGGAGFIGSHLCERLLKDEVNVICVDNFVTSSQNNIDHLLRLPRFKFINHDFTQPMALEQIEDLKNFQISVFGIQEVYNLACPTSVKNFNRLKKQSVLANTVGLINVLELAVKYKAKFLQLSSSVVYGQVPRDEVVKESYLGATDPLDERACYDEGKRYAESVTDTYRDIHKLDTKIARVFRTYGPRMLLDDGQMLPDFILNALDNKDLTIYGKKDSRTSLTYISDIVEGLIRLMESSINAPVNLGSTDVAEWADVAKKIVEITGSKSKIKFAEEQLFMRELALPDITKIKEELGWFPIVTLAEGLQHTVDYTRAHKDLLAFSTEV
ncbi:MAG: GDP-mannose 4,6-dehydratase [Parcubacteria group bacterium]